MTDDEALRQRYRLEYELHCRTLASLPGADTLISQFGTVPTFHDAEVERVQLEAKGESTIRLATPYPDRFSRGRLVVTFQIAEIVDADLDFFSTQNILYHLHLRPASERPDRRNYLIRRIEAGDLEIELEPSCGLGGTIVCRGISLVWFKDRRARQAGATTVPATEPLGR